MRVRAIALRTEESLATLAFAGIMLLPLAEIVVRTVWSEGIRGAAPFAQNLTVWVGLLGAAIAAREGKLLTLATGEFLPKGRITAIAHVIAAITGSAIATMFAMGGAALVTTSRAVGDKIAVGVPVWISVIVFPVAFGLIALRLVWKSSDKPVGRAIAALGIVAGYWIAGHWELFEGHALWPWLMVVLVSGLFGAPIFSLLGGIAMFAFFTDGSRPVVPLIKAYEELTSPSANLAAIPLFTLAGLMFAEGKSSETIAARPARVLRLVPGRHRGRGRHAVRVLHAVHRRIGRHDSRARRPAAAGAAQGRLSRAVFDGPADRGRIARPALPSLRPAHSLWHRRAEHRAGRTERVDQGLVHRRTAAGSPDAWTDCPARRARGDRSGREARTVPAARGLGRPLGSQVGNDAACRRADVAAWRICDDVGVRGDCGVVCRDRAAVHPSRSADHQGSAAGLDRLPVARGRRARDSFGRGGTDELPRQRAGADAPDRVDQVARRIARRLPARAERLPAARRHA